jgi:hypothetical protein
MDPDQKPAPTDTEIEKDVQERADRLEKDLQEAEIKHPPQIDKAEDGGVI